MLSIDDCIIATNEEWDEVWRESESATYFHSREWAETWYTYTNGAMSPQPRKIIFSDGKTVLLPIMCQNYYGGIIKRYALTGPHFISKYGNWLSRTLVNEQHISLLTAYIINTFKNVTWQLNPFDKYSKQIITESKYVTRVPHVAYAIDLTKGENVIYSNLKPSCRNHIKQAVRNDLRVSECTTIDYMKIYYDIYLDNVKRWGNKSPYTLDWKLFEILIKKNSATKLWLVWHNEIAIAGCINFYSNGKIIGWHMASLTKYLHLRPVHLLEYSMIKDGISNNYSWYDMGTDAGSQGLRNFKKSFGPEKLMCDKIYAWHPVLMYLVRLRNIIRYNKTQSI